MTVEDARIGVARALFEAWSSGDADAPAAFMHDDAVLYDIVGGEHTGWPAIRAFFAQGLEKWSDLVLAPDEYWTNESGVALRWVMTATIPDDTFGPEQKGRKWSSEGMTYLVFDGDRVAREIDYHDSGAVRRSLGLGAA
jgi:steroid delta-isomerase-like uncharacterized protein